MKKDVTTKFKLDPSKVGKTDWSGFDELRDADVHAAALRDPDSQPASAAQLARARRAPDIKAVRQKLGLTQEQFAARFGLPLGTVRDWEQGAHKPDRAAEILLCVIAAEPEAVVRALAK
jgi:putative transcriptional regulator